MFRRTNTHKVKQISQQIAEGNFHLRTGIKAINQPINQSTKMAVARAPADEISILLVLWKALAAA